ncbi:Oidioi.mRNA.OKI2018_I69.PAR.g10131.t1.cds [Oikopleura dioica]|uniref:Oidioi.mRNA.OKI2018_I69.PAR.g10131.t1.cds n=1 Tax=Oikopleura dioica TaxID=34765 RepID=A0ABN7RS07_OIKDI|nr:Oidioi.mRNA.OKI2018_I69.PAR.g10131.t1.cds [Oikopleura dioica]
MMFLVTGACLAFFVLLIVILLMCYCRLYYACRQENPKERQNYLHKKFKSTKSSPCPHRVSNERAKRGIRGAFAKNTMTGLLISGPSNNPSPEVPKKTSSNHLDSGTTSRPVPVRFNNNPRFISV